MTDTALNKIISDLHQLYSSTRKKKRKKEAREREIKQKIRLRIHGKVLKEYEKVQKSIEKLFELI